MRWDRIRRDHVSQGLNPTDADGLGDSLRRPAEARPMLLEERLDFSWCGGPPSVSGLVERHFRQAYFRVTTLDGSDRRGRRRWQTDLLEGADREESALTLGAAYRAAGWLYLGLASQIARIRFLLLQPLRGSTESRSWRAV